MTAPTLSAASDALARLDDGVARPGDRVLAGVLDVHCRPSRFCLICGEPGAWECVTCHNDAEREIARSADV